MPWPLTALVLAGGAGRRMHGRDKGLLTWCGRPLVAWVLARGADQADAVLVSANRHLADYRALGHPVVSDPRPGLGPLGGLLSALPHLPAGHALLTLPCDTPRLPADFVARLRAGEDAAIRVARDPERVHWLLALYPPGALAGLDDYLAAGGRSVQGFIRARPHRLVPFPDPEAFANLNTPADLEALPCPR